MARPKVSVVVATRHRPQGLARCLASLSELEHQAEELIVVDNSAGDVRARRIAEDAGARYLHEAIPGVSRAHNVGARAAAGDIVAFIDDDAVADRQWLTRHLEAFQDPVVAATTGPYRPIALETSAARGFAATGGFEFARPEPFRLDRTTPDWFEIANFGGMGLGSNMLVRRSLFARGWGFRESIGAGRSFDGDEHYAFFTIIRDGHAIVYVPDAVVYHEYPSTAEAVARRRGRMVEGTAAYITMLLVEEPEFRRRTLRYVWGILRRVERSWRPAALNRESTGWPERLRAALKGPLLYARSRISGRRRLSASG